MSFAVFVHQEKSHKVECYSNNHYIRQLKLDSLVQESNLNNPKHMSKLPVTQSMAMARASLGVE